MRIKRLYRAIAYYADGSTVRRHFQTKLARDMWAEARGYGYSESPDQPPIPKAVKVEIAESEPVIFRADYDPVTKMLTKEPAALPDHTDECEAYNHDAGWTIYRCICVPKKSVTLTEEESTAARIARGGVR